MPIPLITAALGLLEGQQKKQQAAKQGQVDAANSSLIQGIDGMPAPVATAPAASGSAGQLGSIVNAVGGMVGEEQPKAAKPAGTLADVDPELLKSDDAYEPLGGGQITNALRRGSYIA